MLPAVCIIFLKINSHFFESKDEQRKHTGTEMYDTFWGHDFEKKIGAVFERVYLSNFNDPRFLSEMKEIRRSFWTNWTVFTQALDIAEDAITSVPGIQPGQV